MKDFQDPLKSAFMDMALQDLQGVGSKPKASVPAPVTESTDISRDAFAQAALQDLGGKPAAPAIKETVVSKPAPVVEEASEKIVEQFMKEASEETSAVLKKMLKSLR